MKEFELINRYFKKLANSKNSRNLEDDTASIHLKSDQELIISKDLMVEDVHFKFSNQPFNIAYKLMQSNLSDIASSGSKPFGYVLGFGKNHKTDEKFVKEFCQGLKSIQDQYNLKLLGGDTVNSDKSFFSITIFGIAKKNQILTRSMAKDQDLIFVSGTIGDAGIGLKLLENNQKKYQDLINRHLKPIARINLGLELVKQKISKSAIDISDGFLADLSKISSSSNLHAKIYLENIPISKSAKLFLANNQDYNPLNLLNSGDDYELIFTSPKKNLKKILDLANKLSLNLSCVGEFYKSSKIFDKTIFSNNQLSLVNNSFNDKEIIANKKYCLLFKKNDVDFYNKINFKNLKLGYEHE